MAVSIDWGTSIITVPKADLTLIQSVPTEIREMNINWFRLALKDLEDSAEGMPFLKTHVHNTEVILGGLTFARVVEILAPYTITFENGAYAVNLVGANSNIGDRVNVNNVSVRSQNSAGLISTPLIEYASYEGGVWWDEVNGAEGTLFPIGTRLRPTKTLTDAKLIADYRGFNVIYVVGNGTLTGSINFTGFIFEGQTHVNNHLIIDTSINVIDAVFRELSIAGVLDGGNELTNCITEDLEYVNGHIHNCGLIGTITLAGGADAIFINCHTIDPYDPPTINMGGSGQNLIMPNYTGILYITNLTGSNFVGIGLNAGQIILNSTSVTAGTIQVSGIGELVDESGNLIASGTWNGGVTIINGLLNKPQIADAIWDEPVSEHQSVGSAGESLDGASAPTVEEIRTEMDDNSEKLAEIKRDVGDAQALILSI